MKQLGSLTSEELIALVRVKQDATELERELAQALASALDEIEELEQQMKEMD